LCADGHTVCVAGGILPSEARMKRAGSSSNRYLRPARLLSGLVAVLAVLSIVTACGSSSGGGASPSASPTATATSSGAAGGGSAVEIKNFMFTPMSLTVAVGTTVTWTFDDSTQHTVTADDNSFASSALANHQTFTHVVSTAGTVPYHCSIHSFMTGTIIVK
jgi:plastocyanin